MVNRRNIAVSRIILEARKHPSKPSGYYFDAADGTISSHISRTQIPLGRENMSWLYMRDTYFHMFDEHDNYIGFIIGFFGFRSVEETTIRLKDIKQHQQFEEFIHDS
jgi:hypothetical protein